MTTLGADQVERFRSLIALRFGLQFEEAKLGWLAELLRQQADGSGESVDLYLARLGSGATRGEASVLAQAVTVAETYFFRNIDQFHALREQVVPERLREQAPRCRLRVLSAGCASGEEAYSIAITLHDLRPDPSCQFSVRAVDLNPAVIEKARRGRYTAWAMREMPPALKHRWLRSDGSDWVIADSLRAAVTFEERNINEDDPDLWQPAAYDVVFCRNVLMYFSQASAQATVARIARSLVPGGYLFLGHAETLRGLSQDFHLLHTHGTFYYQRKHRVEHESAGRMPAAIASSAEGPALVQGSTLCMASNTALAAAVSGADTWVEAIGQAAERVRTLTMQVSTVPSRRAQPSAEAWHLGQALELLRHERFAEALDFVQALPSGAVRDPEVLLLRAVLLVHHGDLAQAADACYRLLAVDELNAGAHYVLALCREGMGDRRAAADCDQVAAYLDPAFAMPHLHLGLLARRAGDRQAQRRELGEALALLQREDASRLLLFGGGFGREALLALCRAELQAVGVAA